jgi:hypothetical protein
MLSILLLTIASDPEPPPNPEPPPEAEVPLETEVPHEEGERHRERRERRRESRRGEHSGPPLPAYRQYKAQHLEIRSERIQRGGGYTIFHNYSQNPYGSRWNWGTTQVVPNPISVSHSWGIYQDFRRLSVPEYLEITGEEDRANALRADILGLQRRAQRRNTAGLTGLGITLGSVAVAAWSDDPNVMSAANTSALGGSLLMITGLITSSFPRAKAESLHHSFSASLGPSETRTEVDAFNEALRVGLDLRPRDVISIEEGGRSRQGSGEEREY